jgi:hypothetical protein
MHDEGGEEDLFMMSDEEEPNLSVESPRNAGGGSCGQYRRDQQERRDREARVAAAVEEEEEAMSAGLQALVSSGTLLVCGDDIRALDLEEDDSMNNVNNEDGLEGEVEASAGDVTTGVAGRGQVADHQEELEEEEAELLAIQGTEADAGDCDFADKIEEDRDSKRTKRQQMESKQRKSRSANPVQRPQKPAEKEKQKLPSKSQSKQPQQPQAKTTTTSSKQSISKTLSATLKASAIIDDTSSLYKFKDEVAKKSKGGRIRPSDVLIGLCPVGGVLLVSVEGGYTYAPKVGLKQADGVDMMVCSYAIPTGATRIPKKKQTVSGNFFFILLILNNYLS